MIDYFFLYLLGASITAPILSIAYTPVLIVALLIVREIRLTRRRRRSFGKPKDI